ncbi:phosphate transport system substrate-binding protein [Elusimicrobium simillimum]|uniref:PstS family phosphate ABC transporter substrate-binding protein n=1 Tax=Elusimicrobium simillimum TaxID=3143438 RepID=UPI003C6FF4CB
MTLTKQQKIAIKITLSIVGLPLMAVVFFWAFILAAFGGDNFYIFTVLAMAPLTAIAYLMLLFYKRGRVATALIYGGLIIICAGVLGTHEYLEHKYFSTPRLSVQDFDLKDYRPFEGAKVAVLDGVPTIKFDKDWPKLDGATAMYPIYSAFAQALYPKDKVLSMRPVTTRSRYNNGELVECSNTPYAYKSLIKGQTDIIFVAGPSESQLKEARDAGVTFNLTPIGKEAFVFFVNIQNPVDNLTLQQVKDIYAGRITNWREVGGPKQRIRAFQRPENSGSQTALENLMKGDKIMKAPTEDRPPAWAA